MSTAQVETATVVGTVTLTGNASVVVTSAFMNGSPKTISVPVTNLDSASTVAGLIRTALAFDSDVSAVFLVSGATDKVILTSHVARANDTTLNISIDNGTCTGLTAAPTSANTTAGSGITNSYATLADYKAWISARGLAGSVGSDSSDDSVIEILIEAASRYIDRDTGQRFFLNSSDETRYYTPNDTYEVIIDPLTEITSISVDYTGTRSYTALTSGQYDALPANAALDGNPYTVIAINTFGGSAFFPSLRNALKVVGKFGWPACPKDIQEATLSIAQSLNSTRSGQTSQGKVTITSAGIVIRPEDVPAFAQKIIQHYRPMT